MTNRWRTNILFGICMGTASFFGYIVGQNMSKAQELRSSSIPMGTNQIWKVESGIARFMCSGGLVTEGVWEAIRVDAKGHVICSTERPQ